MRIWPLLALVALLLLAAMPIAAEGLSVQNANIVNSLNLTATVYYTVSGKSYLDLVEGNPDFALEVTKGEGAGPLNAYVSWAYQAGDSADFKFIGEVGGTGLNYTQLVSVSGGTNFHTFPSWNFYDQNAVYPGIVYAVVSDDNVLDGSDIWVEIQPQGANDWLQGSYTLTDFDSTLNEGTGDITVTVTGITGITSSGSQEIYPGGTSVNKQDIVLGVCEPNAELWAWTCASSNLTSPGVPNTLNTGVVPSENAAETRYLLVNGLNNSFCIGPDLTVANLALTPSTVYQSENAVLNATIQNLGNVNVTSDFNITFLDGATPLGNVLVNGLERGETKYAAYSYDTTGQLSGTHTITALVDTTGLGNCDDTNDNDTSDLSIEKTYSLVVRINGTVTNTFDRPGKPFNVTVYANDSDGNDAVNITLRTTEKNGLNLFAPVQGFDSEGTTRGVASFSAAEVTINTSGLADLALIPMGNKLYLPEYSGENADDYIGNYSIFMDLFNGTTKLQLYNESSDELMNEYNLTLATHTVLDPSALEENSISAFNHNKWLTAIINFMIQAFGNVQKWTAAG